ncbi:hypothetical protein [Oculatella sp. LEGE 06141]|nr:hypothetical protein [Oculatella sp. LEGE 06141]
MILVIFSMNAMHRWQSGKGGGSPSLNLLVAIASFPVGKAVDVLH